MSEPAAILATYSDFRTVKTRKVLQLILEVPVEMMPDVFAKLGFPEPAGEKWVAVGLYTKTPSSAGGTTPMRGAEGQSRERLDETPPAKPNSTRAVMMAKDEEFRRFCGCVTEAAAEFHIKTYCDVTSKAALNDGHGAARFEKLRQDFYAWRRAA